MISIFLSHIDIKFFKVNLNCYIEEKVLRNSTQIRLKLLIILGNYEGNGSEIDI